MSAPRGPFTTLFLKATEPVIFSRRAYTLAVLAVATLFMAYRASLLERDASFDKQLPSEHEYIEVFRKYQADFGTTNRVLVAVARKDGTLYEPDFLETLRKATEETFFLSGVDRARVSSLFTPDVGFVEITEQGFQWGNVVPAEYAPTHEMANLIRSNVLKSGIVGRLVSADHRIAMVWAELLEHDPRSGDKLDYVAVSRQLEDLRARFTLPQLYEYRLKVDHPPFRAGETVARRQHPLPALGFLTTIEVSVTDADGGARLVALRGSELVDRVVDNPDYNPGVDIHIIGFAKVVGDVSEASTEVVGFFAITLLITFVLLWAYCGSVQIALLPLACALVAVVWELGLLQLAGLGLDPYAILVPFLVLALAVSHGVQITNFWMHELARSGHDGAAASLATYRRLVIPGLTALLTNIVGFGTILLVPIDIVREMALNACFGCVGVILAKKVLLPMLLASVRIPDVERVRARQARRDAALGRIWDRLAGLTRRRSAALVLIIAALAYGWAEWRARDLTIGELSAGAPELKADGRYNLDAAVISRGFVTGLDVLKVMAEARPDACIDYAVMESIERFAWHMSNVPGVLRTVSLSQVAAHGNRILNEGSPKWRVLPANRYVLAQVTGVGTASGLLNSDCSVMPVMLFLADHRADTVARVTGAVEAFRTTMPGDAPVQFALASGNAGVVAATNEVILTAERKILLWVYAAIAVCTWLSFQSLVAVICVLTPLALVSMLAYAVMTTLGIGLKVATLPVAAFAAGIGVDYGIYIYSVFAEQLQTGHSLRQAYGEALRQTGTAVMFTALALATGVATWMMSDLQLQVDMGLLLTLMFLANAIGAVLLLPALAAFLLRDGGTHRFRGAPRP